MKKTALTLAALALIGTAGCESQSATVAGTPTLTSTTATSTTATSPTITPVTNPNEIVGARPHLETSDPTEDYDGSLGGLMQAVLATEGIDMTREEVATYAAVVCVALDDGMSVDESVSVAYEAWPHFSMDDHWFAHGVVIQGTCDHHNPGR